MDTVTTSCTCTSGTQRSDEVRHPLDPLTAAEIRAVVQIVRDDPQYGADFLFETIELLEPEKSRRASVQARRSDQEGCAGQSLQDQAGRHLAADGFA